MANMMLSGSRFAVGSARCVSRRVQPGCIVMRLSASHPAAPLRPKMIRNVLRGLPGRAARRLQPTAAQKPEVEASDSDAGFGQAFVRSFLLGLGAGCIVETLHVLSKFVGVIGQVAQDQQLSQLGQVLPSLSHQFAPLFAADHAVAIAFWGLFYTMEAGAIMTILSQHGGNQEAAGQALSQLKTLPQILLPTRFSLIKALVRHGRGLQPAASTLLGSPGGRAPADKAAEGGPPGALAFLDAGEAVLDSPRAPTLERGPSSNVLPAPPGIRTNGRTGVVPAPGQDTEADRARRTLPGQVVRPERSDSQWAHRTKELLSRRLYLKNTWYAAALSENVGHDPVGVEMLSEKIVLFRDDSGKVVAINDVCPHRGAPLHEGWVTKMDGDSCVVCPYHGWAFDGEGHVRDVPASQNKGDWPKMPVVSAYDVVEKGGFVWLFNGSKALPMDARPPIPYAPELDDPQWKAVYGEIEFECGHWPVFENAIDMAHIHYLHSDSFGNKDAPSIREMKAERGPYSVSATFALTNKPVNALWEWSRVPEVLVRAEAHLPSTSVISFTLGNGLSFTTFVNTVPINENRTVNRFALVRNLRSPVAPGAVNAIFNAAPWDKFARDAMIKILSEDKAMVEQLRPDLLQREVNVKADGVQTAFRLMRQEYINLGYGVLPYSAKQS